MGSLGSPKTETSAGSLGSLVAGIFRTRRNEGRSLAHSCRSVRPIRSASRSPITPVERLAGGMLEREGEMPLRLLVELVARPLYREAVLQGAWVVDIGIFGWKSFIPEVAAEIEAADGILWQIGAATGGY